MSIYAKTVAVVTFLGDLKMVFGKGFSNVCITTLRFNDPDAEALECIKKMVEVGKLDIIENIP